MKIPPSNPSGSTRKISSLDCIGSIHIGNRKKKNNDPRSFVSSHSLHTNWKAWTSSPMKGLCDASGWTQIEAIAATFAILSKGKSNQAGSTIDSKPSLLVRSGRGFFPEQRNTFPSSHIAGSLAASQTLVSNAPCVPPTWSCTPQNVIEVDHNELVEIVMEYLKKFKKVQKVAGALSRRSWPHWEAAAAASRVESTLI